MAQLKDIFVNKNGHKRLFKKTDKYVPWTGVVSGIDTWNVWTGTNAQFELTLGTLDPFGAFTTK